jgi:predicted PurR-regulated permease PerM
MKDPKNQKNKETKIFIKGNKIYLKIFILAAAILLAARILSDFGWLYGIFAHVAGIVSPFVFGFIIAYCINIPVSWLEIKLYKIKFKLVRKVARPLSIFVNLAALIGFIVFGLMNLIPMIVSNAQQLISELPGYIDSLLVAIKEMPFANELGLDNWFDELDVTELVAGFFEPTDIALWVSNFFSGVFNVFLTIVATIYFLAEYNKVREFIKRLIRAHSPKRQRPALKYIRLVDFSFRKFLTCQFLDSLILGTITMIQFTIMRSEYAVTLALMLGVLNIIPYFGSIFGSMIAIFIIWATSGTETAIIVAIMLIVTQQIDGNFINPRIMGSSFKISPVMVIIGITVGGAIGGVIGMIFAIPVVNVLKTVLEEYIQNKEQQRAEAAARIQESDRIDRLIYESQEAENEEHK